MQVECSANAIDPKLVSLNESFFSRGNDRDGATPFIDQWGNGRLLPHQRGIVWREQSRANCELPERTTGRSFGFGPLSLTT